VSHLHTSDHSKSSTQCLASFTTSPVSHSGRTSHLLKGCCRIVRILEPIEAKLAPSPERPCWEIVTLASLGVATVLISLVRVVELCSAALGGRSRLLHRAWRDRNNYRQDRHLFVSTRSQLASFRRPEGVWTCVGNLDDHFLSGDRSGCECKPVPVRQYNLSHILKFGVSRHSLVTCTAPITLPLPCQLRSRKSIC